MSDDLILKVTSWETVGRVAVIRLNRPHRNNAWTGRMHHEYRALIERAETDPDIRCIVVTGEGRSFCVGADSDALAGHADRGGYDPGLPAELPMPGYGVRDDYDDDFVFHYGLRTPVIASINGPCAGVGWLKVALRDGVYALGSGSDDDIQLIDVSLRPGHARLRLAGGPQPRGPLPRRRYRLSRPVPRPVG